MIKNKLLFFILLISKALFAQEGIFANGRTLKENDIEKVPFKLNNNHIISKVKINGNTYKILIDTGAPTSFTSKVKGDFKIIKEDNIMDASQNVEKVTYYEIPMIKLGNIVYENIAVMKLDSEIMEDTGIDGIIGANIIAKNIWNFDLENHSIIISDSLNQNNTKEFNNVEIKKLYIGSPKIELEYFSRVREHIIFDTGYDGLFYFSEKMFKILQDEKLIDKIFTGKGLHGKSAFDNNENREASVLYRTRAEIKINEELIPPIIADVDIDEESNLGSEWLKYYHTIISHDKFYFKRNKAPIEDKSSTIGINAEFINNELVISSIWGNSQAYKSGIRYGDKILSVNGKKSENAKNKKQKGKLLKVINTHDEVVLEINKKGNYHKLKKEAIFNITS